MKTRLYFILADENLFHPYFLRRLINEIDKKQYIISGISISKDRYKNGFIGFLIQQLNLWGLFGFTFIAVFSIYRRVFAKLIPSKNIAIENVAKNSGIKVIKVDNVNDAKHLSYLKKLKVDILVSSNGQIFKKELLKLPTIACVNRHTALLPKYGGVLPVFWAMLNNEREFGVSIHYMTEKIDEGDIIYREKIFLSKKNSMFKNYILGFDKSVIAVINALENIKNKKISVSFNSDQKQYYSFPDYKTIVKLKKGKYKTFHPRDIVYYFTSNF